MYPVWRPLLQRTIPSAVGIIFSINLLGCASTGEKVVHTARISDQQAKPSLNLFRDRGTSASVWASAFMFGMPGLLISSAIAGHNNRGEMNRWSASGGVNSEAIVPIMTEQLRAALERSGKLTFPKSGPTDLDIHFREINFGMRNKGSKRYAIIMEAEVVFSKAGDRKFYEFGEDVESTTALTIEEYGRKPEAFRQGVTEIATKFAQLVAEDYEMPDKPKPRR